MIGFDGQKMSKSLGNLVLVSRLRAAGTDPMAVRLGLLAGHYRQDREWFADTLSAAEARLARWRRAASLESAPAVEPVLDRVRERLADDLDTPACLAAVDRWADEAITRGGRSATAPGVVRDLVDALLGVDL
jgi:L-cysteine:1D-myo-inositol 2-amino-2-deoxy-alpha-D-glucopyranoside ligase